MTDNQVAAAAAAADEETVAVPRSVLERAYAIADNFSDMLSGDVMRRTGILYMTDGYEGLDAACGLLGPYLGGDRKHLLVTGEDARQALKDAYLAVSLAAGNSKEGTELADICAGLEAALYGLLNMCYNGGDMLKSGIESALGVCGYADDILDGLEQAGPESLEGMYENPSGSRLDTAVPLARSAIAALRPMAGNPEGGAS